MKVRLPRIGDPKNDALAAALELAFERVQEYPRIPAGGTTGQALVKASDRDNEIEWGAGGGGGTATAITIEARNATGATITKGSAVYVNGSLGANLPTVALAQANALTTSRAIGLASADIPNNTTGTITVLGVVDGLNTSGFTAGDALFLSPTTAGAITSTRPSTAGQFIHVIGFCTISNPATGEIKVMADATSLEIGGGSTSPLTTKGDLWGFSTVDARLPVGTDGQVLSADSTQTLGVAWADPVDGVANIEGDIYWGQVLSLLHFDGTDGDTTFTDSRGRCLWTASADAQLDTSDKKYGTASLLLDGTGDYISTADSNDWNFAGDFTIECWIKVNSISGEQDILSHYNATSNQRSLLLGLAGTGPYYLRFVYSFNGTATTGDSTNGTWSLTTGVWYHIALVRSGVTSKLYIDGVEYASNPATGGTLFNSTATIRIGARGDGTSYFNGRIDDLRVTDGVARYVANFTPPTRQHDDAPVTVVIPALDDLSDVDTTTVAPSTGDILVFDGTNWVPYRGGLSNDARSGAPDALDDEFDYGSGFDTTGARRSGASSWVVTEYSGTSPTIYREGSSIILNAPDNGARVYRLPISGSSWTVETKLKMFMYGSAGSTAFTDFNHVGLHVYDSVSTRWTSGHPIHTSQTRYEKARWTAGTFGSAVLSGVLSNNLDEYWNTRWHYLQLQYDGTNLTWRVSGTGLPGTWLDLFTETLASHIVNTPTHVGITVNPGSGSTLGAVIDYIRKTA